MIITIALGVLVVSVMALAGNSFARGGNLHRGITVIATTIGAVLGVLGYLMVLDYASPDKPHSVTYSTRAAVEVASDVCGHSQPDTDDPAEVRDTLMHLADNRCGTDYDLYREHVDCRHIAGMLKSEPSYWDYVVHKQWHLSPSYKTKGMLEGAQRAIFSECLRQAAQSTYDILGIEAPGKMSENLLYETWIELCGDGRRSYRKTGLFSDSASESGTDHLLVSGLVSGGHEWDSAVEAVLGGYEENSVWCESFSL